MRSKAIGTLVSIGIIIVSILLIGVSIFFYGNSSSIIFNIGIGVLGSGVVSFVMTFSEYFVEKRSAQEQYYNASLKIIKILHKIVYAPIGEEAKLIAAYNHERQGDKWRQELGVELELGHFQNLCDYYNKSPFCDFGEFVIGEEKTQVFVDVRLESIKNNIEDAMKSYIAIDSVSLEDMENAYGNLFFISDLVRRKNDKLRNKIYLSIHNKIREMCRYITQENYHFNIYFTEKNGNMPAIVDKIESCNEQLFLVEVISDNQHIVWAKWCDDLFESIEKFRCEIYKDKYIDIERTPIQMYFNGILQNKSE